MKTLKIGLCLPWYAGVDPDCTGHALMLQHYLGRAQERLWWMRHSGRPEQTPPPLDTWDSAGEIPDWAEGITLEFVICAIIGYSLPGIARERAIDAALEKDCDYIFFYDDDMVFNPSVFFRLLSHQKPVVAALAFTARVPITPVIYKFNPEGNGIISNPVLDYRRNQLQKVDAIGFGVVMIQASVFRKLPKPWFSSPGVGEDIQFCAFCRKYSIDIFADTGAKTVHKPRYSEEWHSEEMYLLTRDEQYQEALAVFEKVKADRLIEVVKKEIA